jgi:hypothetical protein
MTDRIEMPDIDTPTYSREHPDRGTRTMQVTIWQMYGDKLGGNTGWERSKKYKRLVCAYSHRRIGIVIFDSRPKYARKKAYIMDRSMLDTLKPGKTYDLQCRARSWKYGVPTVLEIDTHRIPYISALLREIGIARDVVAIILTYAM